jgi:hypothetical protein
MSIDPSAVLPEPDDSSSSDEEVDEKLEKGDMGLDVRLTLEKCIFLTEQMLVEGRTGLNYRVRTSELPSGRVLSGEWREDP